jgi:hypothetical protein
MKRRTLLLALVLLSILGNLPIKNFAQSMPQHILAGADTVEFISQVAQQEPSEDQEPPEAAEPPPPPEPRAPRRALTPRSPQAAKSPRAELSSPSPSSLPPLAPLAKTAPGVSPPLAPLAPRPGQNAVPANKGFKTKLLEIKNVPARELLSALYGLLSGEQGILLQHSSEFNTITVRDYPENIAVVEQALKRLDVPHKKTDLEIEFHLLLVSRDASASGQSRSEGTLPAGVGRVVTQLQSALQYKNYRYITSFVGRVREDGRVKSEGDMREAFSFDTTKITGRSHYSYDIQGIDHQIIDNKEIIALNEISMTLAIDRSGNPEDLKQITPNAQIKFSTGLNLQEGEMVVLGNANTGRSDEALIVVVTARKAK